VSTTIKLAKGDIFVNSAGHVETITSINKAAQDVSLALLQEFDPVQDFGSELAELQTPQFSGLGGLRGLIGQKVQQAMDRLIRLQNLDRDIISAEERIDSIKNLRVIQLNDVLSFQFILEVVVESGDTALQAMLLDISHQIPNNAIPGTPGVAT